MTLFLKCAQFRQTLLARILMGPPPLVPSFAPLSHMYASPGSLLYKKPSIWDKNSAFFAIFFRHWIKGFQWRFLYRNAREGCKYNAYHAEKVIFLWIFVKNPLIMILRSFFIVKSTPFQWTDWTSAEQSWFHSYFMISARKCPKRAWLYLTLLRWQMHDHGASNELSTAILSALRAKL